jgi:putative phosphoesterase
MRVGVVADTHGLVRPQVLKALSGCEHILHAGDIGSPDVIERLREVAPVTAIRGNVDRGVWADEFPHTDMMQLGRYWIYLLHDRNTIDLDPAAAGVNIVISGHSHKPGIENHEGVLYINPGSVGPRRFTLPTAFAILEVTPESAQARLVELRV